MKTLFSLIVLLTLPLGVTAGEPLRVENAWVREAPPTAQVLGAFMHLHNTGDTLITITGASSPACAAVEIHRTVIEDGVARMIPQPSLQLDAGEHIDLAPGGYHLMLIQPQQPLQAGATVTIELQLGDGGSQSIQAQVRKGMGEMGGHDHEHMHHH